MSTTILRSPEALELARAAALEDARQARLAGDLAASDHHRARAWRLLEQLADLSEEASARFQAEAEHAAAAGALCADHDADGACDACGVALVECGGCGGAGYHRADCIEVAS